MWRTTKLSAFPLRREVSHFNPRPPCGGRPPEIASCVESKLFQSTSPVWRTTSRPCLSWNTTSYFNPRPPCGGRLVRLFNCAIHLVFQSTSPVWRTTFDKSSPQRELSISIHVPRVEDDKCRWALSWWCGEFQSTSPVWRTT